MDLSKTFAYLANSGNPLKERKALRAAFEAEGDAIIPVLAAAIVERLYV